MQVVHDFAFDFGGAERVTRELLSLPGVEGLTVVAGSRPVIEHMYTGRASVLYRRDSHDNYRQRAILRALAGAYRGPVFEGDVLCSSYAFAHWFPTVGRKIVYCHSPFRQIWSSWPDTRRRLGGAKVLGSPVVRTLRKRDISAAEAVSLYIATSRAVKHRITTFYGLEGDRVPIIRPPVDREYFLPSDAAREDFFLFAGRIVEPYKRLSLLVDAFRELPYRLVVAGDGRDRLRLQSVAPENVTFVGSLGSRDLATLMQRARGLLFPSLDDYGMVPAEAISCGTPVLAFRGGGALDTVETGVTGLFFDEPSVHSLKAGLREFASRDWDYAQVASAGYQFGTARFRAEMGDAIAI